MVERAVLKYGRLDFAFNNGGVEGLSAPTHECTHENWDRTIGINLKGVWLCMKHEIVQMLRQGNGTIVNNASIAGLVGFQNIPAYVASKTWSDWFLPKTQHWSMPSWESGLMLFVPVLLRHQ
jgi:NAD(P)-dependent dehydrogenase (short-subunit alcohol dehydrogenase family)